MKLTFLGVSSALSPGYNSNILIEDGESVMLFDCGEDIKHSLKASGRKPEELTDVYISHLHFDHCAGLSWLGYYSYFILKKRLTLYIHESMVSDLWSMLRPAMEKLDGRDMVTLDEYFDVIAFRDDGPCVVGSFYFKPVKQVHVETANCNYGSMYSYGILLQKSTLEGIYWKPIDRGGSRAFISSDTKRLTLPNCFCDYIFCDCDIMNLDGVHPNYNDLKKLDDGIKNRMWLYHYHDFHDIGLKMPDAVADGFAGFVKEGQIFEL